MPYQIRQYDKT
jgi:fatty acid desaturase